MIMNMSISMQHGATPIHTSHVLDPYLWQGCDPTCAVKVQQAILRAYGIDVPIDRLVDFASKNGWYNNGTPLEAIGNIDRAFGIGVHTMSNTTVEDICSELDAGHLVGAVVDAHELWKNGLELKIEHLKDIFLHEDPNHALIINGINPEENSITLSDSAYGDFRIEYPLDKFMNAFHDSGNFVCATDTPVYYEYVGNGRMQLTSEGLEHLAGPSFTLADFNKSEFMNLHPSDSCLNMHMVASIAIPDEPCNTSEDFDSMSDDLYSFDKMAENNSDLLCCNESDIPDEIESFDMNEIYPDLYWGM